MEKCIVDFLKDNHVMVVSTAINNSSWSASLFYAFDIENVSLVFLSGSSTNHMKNITVNPNISGAVSSQESNVTRIKGVQFTGVVNSDNEKRLKYVYYKRFPFARAVPSDIHSVELISIKYTSNIAVFGKKIYWERV